MVFNNWINVEGLTLVPYKDVAIGDEIVYKNANGQYYSGIVKSLPCWHDTWSYNKGRKFGISIETDTFVLVMQLNELFTIVKYNRIFSMQMKTGLTNIIGKPIKYQGKEVGKVKSYVSETGIAEYEIGYEIGEEILKIMHHPRGVNLEIKL